MAEKTKKVLDVYRLVIKDSHTILPIPCVNEWKENTQLANIDLFTSHFNNSEEIIEFYKKRGMLPLKEKTSKLIIEYGSGKKLTTRPVLYQEDEVVSGFANRDDVTCQKENLELFASIFLENMRVGTFLNFLDTEKIYHYNGRSIDTSKKRTSLNSLISLYFDQMGKIKVPIGDINQNERVELEMEKNETIKKVAEELEKSYRLVRDLCFGIKNYNLTHPAITLRKPTFKIEKEAMEEIIPFEKTEKEQYREQQLYLQQQHDEMSGFDLEHDPRTFQDEFDRSYDDDGGISLGNQKRLGGIKGIPNMYEE